MRRWMPAAWAWGSACRRLFLEAAAPAYLTDAEWDALGEDWLEQALAYTAVPCKGVRGPLTRIRSRPARSRAAGPGSRDSDEQPGDGQASLAGVPLYRLADYLDQHGRHHRRGQFPPAWFWVAAAGHALPGDQAALGDAACARGLYRDAAQLYKNAAARGNLRAVLYLGDPPDYLSGDVGPVRWAVAHVSVGDPDAVTDLLYGMPPEEQVTALLDRDPAAHASLEDLDAVAGLLGALWAVGAAGQVTALADRAAAHIPLNDPAAVADLLWWLPEVGAKRQATALLHRDPQPPTPPSATRPPWPGCWAPCGRRARRGRSPCWPVAPPPASLSTTGPPWPSCWAPCGRRARRDRSLC